MTTETVTEQVNETATGAATENTAPIEKNGVFNLATNAIRDARTTLEKRDIVKPMKDVHFRIIEVAPEVEDEAAGFSWLTIDPATGLVGGVSPDEAPAAFGASPDVAKKSPAKTAKQAAAAKEAVKTTDKKQKAEPPPPKEPSPLPFASDNAAKDAQMPTLRKGLKLTDLPAKSKVYPRRPGSKQALFVDMLSRSQGATFGELYDACAATGKPWVAATIRSGMAWDINHITGYGVTSTAHNGAEFAEQGRKYEAHRLGHGTPHYDPELKMLVYRLTYPKGMTGPLAHEAPGKKPAPEPKPKAEKKAPAKGGAKKKAETKTEG